MGPIYDAGREQGLARETEEEEDERGGKGGVET